MNKRRIVTITSASAVALISTIAGLSAIFTDVTEPYTTDLRVKYTSDFGIDIGSENTENNAVLTPGESVAFDPYLENTGSYDAYVFMTLETPDDSLVPRSIGEDWTKVEDGVWAYAIDGVLEPLPAKTRNENGEFVHSATSPLCTELTLEEGSALEQGTVQVTAVGYAVDAEEADSTSPSEVWALLQSSEQGQ